MTLKQVKKLHAGDEVYYADPDNAESSVVCSISSIEVKDNIVCITDTDGNYLEFYAKELS